MCMAIEKECFCGKESARIHHANSILPSETVKNVYCPSCSKEMSFDSGSMIEDNGWIIDYDMEVAALYTNKMGIAQEVVTPDFIFDEGFSAWQGFTPNDIEQANKEKTELAKLAKTDPQNYLRQIREWTVNRAKKLHEEGWRKASPDIA